jgi:hypothetical protein
MHEVLTQGGLDVVRLVRNRSGQIGLQDFLDLWEHFALIRSAFLFSVQREMTITFSVLVSGKNGRNSMNPLCLFRMGRTSLRITFTNSSFFSSFGINSTIRANMGILLSGSDLVEARRLLCFGRLGFAGGRQFARQVYGGTETDPVELRLFLEIGQRRRGATWSSNAIAASF